ncbi:ALBINO3-like protein 2, chloroplastic isoform X2 [Populus alba]|uniref:ALBINO3-like protein 2, chloroplastic isoform X2 n=1 Tax=Populus alba TaxID=43335 RepID=UPI00158B67C3|nr:ALBINO3-like protein 2, chloroplastic isoform X2 [Populus alba]
MTASNLMLSALRRSRPLSTLSRLLANPNPNSNSNSLTSQPAIPSRNSLASFHFPSCQSFSTRTDDDSDFLASESPTASEPINFKLDAITEGVVNGSNVFEESIFPVGALLESCHDLTGLPWWIIIASSTLAMRMTLFPLLVLQMYKIKQISLCFPKLPPLLPPPLSGRSYWEQITIFRKERRAICCPPFSWFLAYLSVQCPCFLLWMTSIRRMSLNNHPGFDCGGTLWFQNLTEFPHGGLAFIFPLLIAGLHYVNVQLSFDISSIQNTGGLLGLLSKYYKYYLIFLTLPMFFIGYCIPQQVSLKHPVVGVKLGLLDKDSPKPPAISEEMVTPESVSLDSPTKWRKVSPENLSPDELLALSVQLLSSGHRDRAISMLQMALKKDPNHIKALIVMGHTLLQEGLHAEATDHLERAISKLFLAGHPTTEDVNHLILTLQWAGVACISQGNKAAGIVHLERVASLEEPEDPKSKAHYFDGLLLLASALSREGRKAEAVKYLRLVVAYDPSRKDFLEECENDEDSFVGDLVSSRRGDY